MVFIPYVILYLRHRKSGLAYGHMTLKKPVSIISAKLRIVEPGQYQDLSPLENIRRCKLGWASCVIDKGTDMLNGDLTSNFSWFCYIRLRPISIRKFLIHRF